LGDLYRRALLSYDNSEEDHDRREDHDSEKDNDSREDNDCVIVDDINSHFYERFHKHLNRVRPSHLPLKPSSLQAYLQEISTKSDDFVKERKEIYATSANTNVFKDSRIRS